MNASLKNVREQRLLDRELRHIDSKWHHELRTLTKQRLEVTREYTQLQEDKKNVEYLKDQILPHETDDKKRVERLKEYADFIRSEKSKGKKEHKNITKYDFNTVNFEKKRVKLDEVEKPMDLLREIGLSQSFPPIPEKPRLARSNSVVEGLIKAKSTSETNLNRAAEFGIIQRDVNRAKSLTFSLPDIKQETQRPRRFRGLRGRDACLTAIPNISELPELMEAVTLKKRRFVHTSMSMNGRRHTVIF